MNVGMTILNSHAYARGRKAANIVWILIDELGTSHDTFEGMANTGVEHFQTLYKAPVQASIVIVIHIA